MKASSISSALLLAVCWQPLGLVSGTPGFQGRIQALMIQGREATPLLYTVGSNCLRLEVAATNRPQPVNLVDLPSGALTIVLPHDRSFVRLKPVSSAASGLPPGIGPQAQPVTGVIPMPAMAAMPVLEEKLELAATGQKTNLLGFACERFELKRKGEILEVWATSQLLPFEPYRRGVAPPPAARRLAEQWPAMLKQRQLFPLRMSLRFKSGAEQCRFEVRSVRTEEIADPDGRLFRPPPDYLEIDPPPF